MKKETKHTILISGPITSLAVTVLAGQLDVSKVTSLTISTYRKRQDERPGE